MLIHQYTGNCGIGDFLRSALVYYTYCKINEIEYYIDFSETYLKYCFDNKIPLINDNEIEGIYYDYEGKDTKTFLYEIRKNKDKKYIVDSNVYNFIDKLVLDKYKKGFSEFLLFSDKIKNRSRELLKLTGINDDFMCIHVRCGDYYYLKTSEQKLTSPDIRISPEQALINIKYILEKVEEVKKEEKCSSNIIVMCDNDILKDALKTIYTTNDTTDNNTDNNTDNTNKKVSILNTGIYHIALVPYKYDSEYLKNYIDSVVEFYILTKSKKNICLSVSGFSCMSSYIYDVPLYILNESKVLEKVESIC